MGTGRRLLFPRALPSIPVIAGGADHERKRKIAVKCLELEEMLERQGHSQSEIETKVSSFRALLLRQVNSINNNGAENRADSENSGNNGDEEEGKKENGKSWSDEEEASDRSVRSEKRKEKKRKKRPKQSKGRKKKKESRRRRLSSPSYSDYEPENP